MDIRPGPLTDDIHLLTTAICDRLQKNRRVRRRLPGEGWLHIDRQLPFLCVARAPGTAASAQDPVLRLVTSEASFLIAPAFSQHESELSHLTRSVLSTLGEIFGAVLLVQFWPGSAAAASESALPRPHIALHPDATEGAQKAAEACARALRGMEVDRRSIEVEIRSDGVVDPPGAIELVDGEFAQRHQCSRLGVEIRPIYYDPLTGHVFPLLLEELRVQLSRALKQAFCAFAGLHLAGPPQHYEMLGRRELLRAVGDSDEQLCQIASQVDFLLLVNPVNAVAAWREFAGSQYEREPPLYYRPLPFDPNLLKRQLFNIPLEAIEDPTLMHLLFERQEELDRQITMLRDRGTRSFFYGSLQVHGPVEPWLLALAEGLLETVPEQDRLAEPVRAAEIAVQAQREIETYRQKYGGFQGTVELRGDIAAGMMVSRNRLLISEELVVSRSRVEPLLHHEIGTHLLTYVNGSAQPLQQLACGLAHYEPLQEGLAVLAEYLVGGLSPARIRVLAARVLAVHCLCEGATFIETFRRLHRDYALPARSAFTTTLRVYRGGGFTKDATYLRGFVELVEYLKQGHELAPLFAGKMALRHVPLIQELRRREIVQPPHVQPRYLGNPQVRKRLAQLPTRSVRDILGA